MKTMQIYLWIFLLVISRNAFGTSIEVSGAITTNTVWDTDTVKITGDITINNSVTLIIHAGTQVRFQGLYKIEINGRLLALGSPQNRIVFTSEDTTGYASGSDVGWSGIIFNNTPSSNDSSKLEYCIISYCKSTAIDVSGVSKLTISNNEIICNEIGINVSGDSSILINNNIINYNKSAGIKIGDWNYININSNIYHNQISWNRGSGIEITNCSNLLISHNIINHNNGNGIIVQDYNNKNVNAKNNVICKNGGAGIDLQPLTYINVSSNTICYNGEGIIVGPESYCTVNNTILWNYGIKIMNYPVEIVSLYHSSSGSASYCLVQGGFEWMEYYHDGGVFHDHIITDEPKFVNVENDDYSLSAKSPCIDTGTPNVIPPEEVDIIGNSRCFGGMIDIGAYEFINKYPRLEIPIGDYKFFKDSIFMFTFPENTFTDDNIDDSLAYQAKLLNNDPLPEWLLFDSADRKFHGSSPNVGVYTVVLSAFDLFSSAICDTFNIEIINFNHPPKLINPIPDQVLAENTPYSYVISNATFNDLDTGDSLTYNAFTVNNEELPLWLIFDTINLVLHGTPLHSDIGQLYVIIKVTDRNQASCSDTFCLSIEGQTSYINNNYESDGELIVYPNPADDIINVVFKGNWQKYAYITLYDVKGHICYYDKNALITIPHLINLKGLNKGYYFIEVSDEKYRVISNFILK